MKAVILAGGQSKRLRPLTDDKPKTMVEIGGRPIIEWQIDWLKSHGVTSFVILANYKRDVLINHLGSGEKFGIKTAFAIEDGPLGTGGALKNAAHILSSDKEFLMVNGDVISDIDVGHLKLGANDVAALSLVPLKSPYGVIQTDNSKITRFDEKPTLNEFWINAGIYLMSSEIFDYLPEKGDMEKTAFPELAKENRLAGIKFDSAYWRSVDTVKDVEEVGKDLEGRKLIK